MKNLRSESGAKKRKKHCTAVPGTLAPCVIVVLYFTEHNRASSDPTQFKWIFKKEQKTIKRSQENGNQKKGAQISSAYSFSILAIFHLQPPFAEVLSGMLRAA